VIYNCSNPGLCGRKFLFLLPHIPTVFKANGQRLKIFLEPEIPELEEVDVYELSELE
jgi:hypothetical protein